MEETCKALEGQSRFSASLTLENASCESGRVVQAADRHVLEGGSNNTAVVAVEHLENAYFFEKPAVNAVFAKSPNIKLHELESAVEGVEITRLPWGYAVTRKTALHESAPALDFISRLRKTT